MTISITQVNNIPVTDPTKITIPLDTTIHVEGKGLEPPYPGQVKCTLVSTNLSVPRIATSSQPTWNVTFDASGPDDYQLFCKSAGSGSTSILITVKPADAEKALITNSNRLAFTPPGPSFGPLLVTASGTVLNALDTVNCTLTPINPDGSSRGASQSSPATMNGIAWTVTFSPPPAPPGAPPNQFNGLYLLEATAPNEGTISSSGSALAVNMNPINPG